MVPVEVAGVPRRMRVWITRRMSFDVAQCSNREGRSTRRKSKLIDRVLVCMDVWRYVCMYHERERGGKHSMAWTVCILLSTCIYHVHLNTDSSAAAAAVAAASSVTLASLGSYVGVDHLALTRKTDSGAFEDQDFPHKQCSYGGTLLVHAEVYTFALYHMLTDLQVLALNRVAQTLRKADCDTHHAAGDLTGCIEYIYAETPRTVEEPMRELLSQFVANHYPSLLRGDSEVLLTASGDLTRDVGQKVSRCMFAQRT